jgi:hypothetical protein
MNPNQKLLEDAVTAVRVSNLAVEKAAAELEQFRTTKTAAASQGEAIADLLVKKAYVLPNERAEVLAIVTDHQKLANLFVSVLNHALTPAGPLNPGQEVAREKVSRLGHEESIEAKARRAFDEALAGCS